MSRLHLPAITAALSLIISCTVAPTTTPIENIINPEDIVAIPNSHWAIVSSIPGGSHTSGSIIAVNAITAEKYTLYPKTQKNSPIAGDCNSEVAARQFAPHGIALSSNSNGEQLLQVVNHGGREAIEHFKVTLSEIPELQWLGCTTLPAGALANAVAAFPSGELYVSNMHKLSETLSAEIFNTVGEVLHWSVKTGWQSIAGSDIPGANGILVSADKQKIFVTSWTQGEIIELSPGSQSTQRRVLKLDFLPDNIRWNTDSSILAAGFQTSVETVIACVMSTQTHCAIPSRIAVIDPVSLTVKQAISVEQGNSTVASPVGDQIWIGTARGDRLYRILKEELLGPATY